MFTVGIDLGTTASVIAFVQHDEPRSIAADSGKKTTPSVVNYGDDYPIVGREAIFRVDASNTVFSIKRAMGSNERFFSKSPEEISADILSFMKNAAENQLRHGIDAAVITVPAHFSESQRIATKRAASIADLKVLRLVSEPAAAAIAFGLDKKASGIYGVYDLGGGTFDFSILRLSGEIFQVLATGGDNYLGGDEIDNAILKHNFDRCGLNFFDMSNAERMLGKLIAKSIKEHLGTSESAQKNFIYRNKKYEFSITKQEISDIVSKYLNRTFEIADQVFRDASLTYNDIDGIVLVGGMTKLNLTKKSVRERFNTIIFDDINPEEVVAFGAAIHANAIASKSGGSLLIDVVPLTLGVETYGGGVDKIIHRNTPIPIIQRREYTTYTNNQTGIKFHIVEGERPFANDCRSIARFELNAIPKMLSGMPRVIVEFFIDVNGLLNIKAYEETTGIIQSVTVEPSSGLTDEEMINILENAAKNRDEDNLNASYLFIKTEAERQIIFWESIVNDIPEKERQLAHTEIELLKKALQNKKYDNIIIHKKNVENIIGEFLDEIIGERLSKKNINVSKLRGRQ